MTKTPWTTDEQLAWFQAKKAEYLERHAQHALEDWWGPVYQDFFDKWPLGPVTATFLKRAKDDVDKAEQLQLANAKQVSETFSQICNKNLR